MDNDNSKRRMALPWWAYLLLAIVFYIGCKYIVPSFAADAVTKAQLSEAGGLAAPIIAIVFLLLAANGLFEDAPPPSSQQKFLERDSQDDTSH